MPLIQRNCIEEIRRKINIYDVVSPYVQLKKSGIQFRGLSPFNEEKTPSFYIHPDKNVFKCYSSGYAGDVFRFVQIKENLNFQEAVETLARRFSIALEYEESSAQSKQEYSTRKEIFEIHDVAADFYHQQFLAKNDQGDKIREYWENNRKFPLSVAQEFSIGYAPTGGSELLKLLNTKGFSLAALKLCGLFYTKEYDKDPSRFRNRFRGRLMIPIRDVQGRVIAFTARQLEWTPEDDPARDAKYINSPETPIFVKSHVLFGLDRARQNIEEAGAFLMVEGQLDAIRCYDAGLKASVAPQGTAITESQLALMRRYTPKVTCLLDGDSAGQKAAMRLLPMALKSGMEVTFVTLPEKADPDGILAEGGKAALEEYLANGKDAMEYAVNVLAPKGMGSSPSEKMEVIAELMNYFRDTESMSFAQSNLKKAGNLLGIYEYIIDKELSQIRFEGGSDRSFKENKASKEQLTTVEYQLLLLALHNEEIAVPMAQIIHPDWINENSLYGKLLDRVLAEIREEIWQGPKSVDHLAEGEEERNEIYSLLSEEAPFENPTQTANICIRSMFKNFYEQQKRDLTMRMANTSKDDSEAITALQRERIQLRKIQQTPPQLGNL